MKRIATSTVALVGFALAAPAFAGSMAEPTPEPTVYTPAPVVETGSDWTGGYAGATLGYGWGSDMADDADDMVYGLFAATTMTSATSFWVVNSNTSVPKWKTTLAPSTT